MVAFQLQCYYVIKPIENMMTPYITLNTGIRLHIIGTGLPEMNSRSDWRYLSGHMDLTSLGHRLSLICPLIQTYPFHPGITNYNSLSPLRVGRPNYQEIYSSFKHYSRLHPHLVTERNIFYQERKSRRRIILTSNRKHFSVRYRR